MHIKNRSRCIPEFIRNLKLRYRIIFATLFMTVTSSVIVGIVSYHVLNSYASGILADSTEGILASTMKSIDNKLKIIDDTFSNVINNRDLAEMLENRNPSISEKNLYDTAFKNSIYPSMFAFRNDYIEYVYIFGRNGINLISTSALFYRQREYSELTGMPQVALAGAAHGKMIWFTENGDIFNRFEMEPAFKEKQITGIRQLHTYNSVYSGNQADWGYMAIKLKNDYIGEDFQVAASRLSGTLLMCDRDGTLFFERDDTKLIPKLPVKEIAVGGSGMKVLTIEGKQYVVHADTSGYTGWTIIYASPKDLLSGGIKRLLSIIQLAVLTMILISIVISVLIAMDVTGPVYRLLKKMDILRSGNLDVSIEVERKDEIGLLSENFNKMVLDIKGLLESVKNDQILIRKTELKVLQAQINPHFLYNTLDVIYWTAMKEGNSDIAKIAIALSCFFRMSLNRGKDVTTITNEVEHARNYLVVQQMRFKDKFTVEIEVEEEVRLRECINMILQPIVENSLIHGLKDVKSGGVIRISATKSGEGAILLTVEDNGAGFDPCYMEETVCGKKPDENESYGLKNVNSRIKLYYGDEYGLSFRSAAGGGAIVVVKLPFGNGGCRICTD